MAARTNPCRAVDLNNGCAPPLATVVYRPAAYSMKPAREMFPTVYQR